MLNARKTLISIAIATSFCGIAQADLLGGGAASSAASTITGGFGGSARGPIGGTLGGDFGAATEAGAHGGLDSNPATGITGEARSRTRAAAAGTARMGHRQAERANDATVAASQSAVARAGTVRDESRDRAIEEANTERSASIAGVTEGSAATSSGPVVGAGRYEAETEANASRENGVSARGRANGEASASVQR